MFGLLHYCLMTRGHWPEVALARVKQRVLAATLTCSWVREKPAYVEEWLKTTPFLIRNFELSLHYLLTKLERQMRYFSRLHKQTPITS